MKEMSVAEQRYKAVLAVIGDGRQVSEVAAAWGVSRQTLHAWLARYEHDGLEGLVDRSHRPAVVRTRWTRPWRSRSLKRDAGIPGGVLAGSCTS
jgi:transposase